MDLSVVHEVSSVRVVLHSEWQGVLIVNKREHMHVITPTLVKNLALYRHHISSVHSIIAGSKVT